MTSIDSNASPLFSLGQIVTTNAALHAAERWADAQGQPVDWLDVVSSLIARHAAGDWGDLDPEDAELNDIAVRDGMSRVFSAYELGTPSETFWVITESDRSVTTLLLPRDY